MQWEVLLADPAWQEVQLLWQDLANWPPAQEGHPIYSPRAWEELRLLLEYHLLALQPLVLRQILPAQALEHVRLLLHLRLERRLESSQTRPNPYQWAPDPYLRPKYNRYHAFQELDQEMRLLQKDPFWQPLLSLTQTQKILEDLNLDLLEVYAQRLGKEAREQHWPTVLKMMIALEQPTSGRPLSEKLAEVNPLKLAEDILQRSRFSGALRAALTILKESPSLSHSQMALQRLLISPGQYSLKTAALELLHKLPEQAAWEMLCPLLQNALADSQQAEGAYGSVRRAALEILNQFETQALKDLARPILQAGIQSSHWGHWSQLKAICILAQWGYSGYLEEVIGVKKRPVSRSSRRNPSGARSTGHHARPTGYSHLN